MVLRNPRTVVNGLKTSLKSVSRVSSRTIATSAIRFNINSTNSTENTSSQQPKSTTHFGFKDVPVEEKEKLGKIHR